MKSVLAALYHGVKILEKQLFFFKMKLFILAPGSENSVHVWLALDLWQGRVSRQKDGTGQSCSLCGSKESRAAERGNSGTR